MALAVKNLPANAGDIRDVGSIPGSGRSPEEIPSNPLQYSCLENSMDKGAWWAIFHGAHKESDMTEHTHQQLIRKRKIHSRPVKKWVGWGKRKMNCGSPN